MPVCRKAATLTVSGIFFKISYEGGTGNDVVLTAVTPDQVYVDDNWAGTPVGIAPATSAPAGLIFGYNAFDTIPAGVAHVTTGGTVTVYGGVYSAALNVNRTMAAIVAATNPDDCRRDHRWTSAVR